MPIDGAAMVGAAVVFVDDVGGGVIFDVNVAVDGNANVVVLVDVEVAGDVRSGEFSYVVAVAS